MTVAERFKRVRGALGLTQEQAASKFAIPLGSLRKYEQGPSEPGLQALSGMARAGVNVHWLLTDEGPMLLADMVTTLQEPILTPYQVRSPQVDAVLLQKVIDFFIRWQAQNRDRVRIDASRHGAVIAVLYKVAQASGRVSEPELAQVLGLAA